MGEALLLLAVCPIGGLSNVYSLLARASTALSVTLTTVSCAAALVTILAASVWLDAVWHHPAVYVAPLPILLRQLLVVLVPPVLLGMAIRWAWPVVATRCRGVVQSAGFGLLFVLLALIIASGGGADLRFAAAATLVVAFLASASPVGWVIGWLLGGSRADRFTFAAEFSTRNVAIALGLALTLHNHRAFVWFGAVYLIFEIPLLALAALAHRRGVAA
jgi:BASS family bile acid:Na+ symporter